MYFFNHIFFETRSKTFGIVLCLTVVFSILWGTAVHAAAPSPPSELTILGQTRISKDTTPTFRVTATETGGTVTLYSNSGCTDAISAAATVSDTAAPYIVDILTTTAFAGDTEKTVYAKHTNAGNESSTCAAFTDAYKLDTTVPTLTVGTPEGSGDTRTITTSYADTHKSLAADFNVNALLNTLTISDNSGGDGELDITLRNHDHFGHSIALDGNTLAVGVSDDDDGDGDNSGAVYLFTKENGTWTKTLKISENAGDAEGELHIVLSPSDYFGSAVALDGDTLAVGAWSDDDNGGDRGAVYLFTKNDGTWENTLKISDNGGGDGKLDIDLLDGDHFGYSAALDGNTLAVGAAYDDNGGTGDPNRGAVYLFTKNNAGIWLKNLKISSESGNAKLSVAGLEDGDLFGFSVALDGTTLAVGAPDDDDGNGVKSGAVYLFTKDAQGNWSKNVKISENDGAAEGELHIILDPTDAFGSSVALDGTTLAVGVWEDDDGHNGTGAAYLFAKDSNGTWTKTLKISENGGGHGNLNIDLAADDKFGSSIALDGTTLAVGARFGDDSGTDRGAAYLFDASAMRYVTQAATSCSTAPPQNSLPYTESTPILFTSTDNTQYVCFWVTDKAGNTGKGATSSPLSGILAPLTATLDTWAPATPANSKTLRVSGVTTGAAGKYKLLGPTVLCTATAYSASTVAEKTLSLSSGSGSIVLSDEAHNTKRACVKISKTNFRDRYFHSSAVTGIDTIAPTVTGTTYYSDASLNTPITSGFLKAGKKIYTKVSFSENLKNVIAADATARPEISYAVGTSPETQYNIVAHNIATLTPGECKAKNDSGAGEYTCRYAVVAGNNGIFKTIVGVKTVDTAGHALALKYENTAPFKLDTIVPTLIVGRSTGSGDTRNITTTYADTNKSSSTDFNVNALLNTLKISDNSGGDGKLAITLSGNDYFGKSVALDGNTLAVGVPDDDDGDGDNSGAVYLFTKENGTWTKTLKISDNGGGAEKVHITLDADDYFGRSVALDGDTLVVGATYDGDGGSGVHTEGAVYLFTKDGTTWTQTLEISDNDGGNGELDIALNEGDVFGISVALDGNTLVVGALGDGDKGAVYLFTKENSAWVKTLKISDNDGGAEKMHIALDSHDRFGHSVALDGTTLAVGAPNDDVGDRISTNTGAVYLFTKDTNAWTKTLKISSNSGDKKLKIALHNYDRFGTSLALDGNTLAVGTPHDTGDGDNSGAVYLFTKDSAVWLQTRKISENDDDGSFHVALHSNDRFGASVALDGITLAIGASYDDDGGVSDTNRGAAYLFDASAMRYVSQTEGSCPTTPPQKSLPYVDPAATFTSVDNNKYVCFWATDKAGNIGKRATLSSLSGIPAPLTATLDTWAPTGAAPSKTLAVSGVTTGVAAKYKILGPTVPCAAKAYSAASAVTEKTLPLTSGSGSIVLSDEADNTKRVCVKLSKTNFRDRYFRSSPITGIDTTVPTVTGTTYYSNAGLSSSIIPGSFLKAGKDIYTKVSFSENVKNVLATNATARPAILYTVGTSSAIQYNIVAHGNTLTSGECKAKDGSGTSEYHCFYTVAASNTGTFKTTVDVKTADTAGNALALKYENTAPFKLDTIVPTLNVGAPAGQGDTRTITTSYADTNKSLATDFNVNAPFNTLKISDNGGSDGELDITLRNNDFFGQSVALDGDTLAVGVLKDDDGDGNNSGAVYLFTKENGTWTKTLKISENAGDAEGELHIVLSPSDYFGSAVALDGDTLAVGAPNNTTGTVYLFTKNGNGVWAKTLSISDNGGALGELDVALNAGDNFGLSVALDGNTLAVGAPYDDNGGSSNPNRGAVYLFTKNNAGDWLKNLKISGESGSEILSVAGLEDHDLFGFSVALDGTTLAVGAPDDDDGNGANSGAVYLFTKNAQGDWSKNVKISENAGVAEGELHIILDPSDSLGSSVALDGNTLAVGAWEDDDGHNGTGAAYLFAKDSNGTWTKTLKISENGGGDGNLNIDLAADDKFGSSIALDGTTLAVGARLGDDSGTDRGAAYLFDASAMRYVTQAATSCPVAAPQNSLPYTESTPILFTSADNTQYACFWATDKAGNTGNAISSQLSGIPAPLTATLDSAWAPATPANSKTLAVSSVTAGAAGKYKILGSTVLCTAAAYSASTVAEKTLSLSLGSGSITISDEADNTKRACVKLSKTNFGDRYFHSSAVTGIDTTAPTVTLAVANGRALTITMSEPIYAATTPDTSDFTISGSVTVSDVVGISTSASSADNTFTLTLSTALTTSAATLSYVPSTTATKKIKDVAGNLLVAVVNNTITNNTLAINSIAGDNFINAAEDDSDVTIAGTSTGLTSGTTVRVEIDDSDADDTADITKNTTVSSDAWQVTISPTDMDALEEGDLTITVSAADTPDATRTITYDRAPPTIFSVTRNPTTLTVIMSEPIYAATIPDTSDFAISGSVTVSGVVGIPTSASTADNTFTLTLSTALTGTATLSYAPSNTATKKIKDVAGNLLARVVNNTITNNTLAINSIAGDNRINAAEDDSAVTIAGTSTGLAQNTEVTVKIDDSDSDIDADITKTSRISSTDTWSVSISSTDMDALEKGDLTITVSAADTPDAIKTITYDIASPTVTGTTYYADAALNSSIASTSFLKAGKKIYTKVVFSEDLEDVLATGATARPEISYTVGSEIQYNIVVHTNTLTSGDCQAKDDSGTREYHCLYTVATGNTGTFKTTVGIKTADKAGNTLATAYEKTASFTLDTTAPTVNNVATKYYADAALNTPITSTSFLKVGKKIYTKVVFSEDLEDVLATGATARPEISYTVGTSPEIQYNIVVHTNTLTSGDCQAKDDSGTREYHCLYTVATGNTGIFKTTVGIKTADKAGNTLATAYEKTASFTLDTTAPTVNNVATKYYADANLNTPITSTSFLKAGKKIYTKVVFSEDLEDVLATGATARPEISYTVGTSPETQYNIVVHTNTLTSGDCQAKDDSGTREYHCLYTVATGNTGIFKTTVGIKTADKAGNTLATAYEKTASFTLDTTAPTVNNVATKYYADAALNSSITSTSFLKVGKKIYTKVVFSEDLEDVLATGATARPEISYTVGTSPETQYNIVVHTNTLTSGDCQAKDDSGTNEYHCLYTVATGNTGIFKTTVGIKTADKAGNTLATAYEKTASFTLDTTAPTVNNVATKYYADAALNTPITSTSFLKVGKKIYTKVVFSEDLEDVLATGATARPEISYTVGTSPETQYNIVVHTNTLTSGDCQAKDDSGTREYHCLYTVATGNTGIFKTTVGIKTADKAGNTLATAYEKTASFTLDTTAPTVNNVATKYYADAALNTPITSTSFLKVGKKIYTKVVFSEDLEDVLATGATARPEISYTVGTSPETQYNIVVHTNTLTSGDCQAKDDSGTNEYHCLYTVATGNTGIFKTTVGIKTADKAGNTLATAYEKTASFTLDTTAPTVNNVATKYYADANLNTPITSTSFLKVGKKIYTKVVFSEDLEDVLATGATARPEISYTVGTSPETQYNIVVHTNTLTSGDCQAKDDSGTREYHCLYTVATGNTGIFKTTVGIKTADKAGNTLATAYEKTASFTLDTTAPTVSLAVASGTTLTITMSEAIYATATPDTSDFTISGSVTVSDVVGIPTSAATADNSFTLTLSTALTGTATLSYVSSTTATKKIKDVADNLLVAVVNNTITNNTLAINSIAGDNRINAAEDDSAVTIAGTSTGLTSGTTVRVEIDDSDADDTADITKNTTVSSDAWQVTISSTDMDALEKGDLTITVSATGAPDAIKTITYDIASPTVTGTTYYADAALNSSITSGSFLKAGKKIYTKVVFSEDLEDVLATGATARPEISYTVGSETQYNIVVHTNTLTSGDCQAKDDSGTNEYHCLYTVATGNTGTFKTTVGIKTADKAGNTLATAYEKIASFTLDTTAPTVNNVATKYYADANLNTPITSTSFLKVGKKIYTKVVFSEDLEDVLATGATARPEISYTAGSETQYNIVVHTNTLTSGDCQAKDDSGTREYHCLYTVATGNTGIFKTTVGIKTADKAGNTLATAYEKTASFTLDTTAPIVNNVATKYYADADLNTPITSTSFLKVGKKIYTKVVFSEDLEDVLATGATARPEISYTVGTSPEIQYNIVVHTNTLTSGDCQAKDDSGTREYHCLYTIATGNTGIFKTTVGIKTADKAGNTLATAYEKTASFTLDTTAPTVNNTATKYYADADLNTPITSTSFLKVGKKIYTKVVFSEDLEDVLATGATARPEISYTVGTSPEIQYNIVVHTNTLTSGDCQAKDDSGTREYHCLYTVATGNTGIFKTTVGIKTADKAGNTLATAYEKTASFTLDTTAPTISSVVAKDTTLTITMDELVYAAATPAANSFTITDGSGATVSSINTLPQVVSGASATFTLTLSVPLVDDAPTLIYTQGTNTITDRAGNALVTSSDNAITNFHLVIKVIAIDDIINATEDDADVIITGTIVGFDSVTTVTVGIDDESANNITKTSLSTLVSSGPDTWSVTIPRTEMVQLQEGTLTITASATDAPNATRTITYDRTSPTVTLAVANGTTLTITMSEPIYATATPDTSDFTISGSVTVSDVVGIPTSAATADNTFTLTLSAALTTSAATLSYAPSTTATKKIKDVAGNLLVSATKNIVNNTLAINSIAGDNRINATEDDSAVTIAGTSTGLAQNTEVTVKIDDTDSDIDADITKTSRISSTDTWSVSISSTEMDALQKGDLTITVSAADTPDAIKTITYDIASPTVTGTTYYADAALNSSITSTSFLKAGKEIYTKVVFSEDLEDVLATGATARPEISYTAGSETQYNIVVHTNTLTSGDCQAKDDSGTNEYHCLYTVATGNTGTFKTTVGIKTADKAGNTLATAYEKIASFTLDTTAPTVNNVATKYYADAALNSSITSGSFLKVGKEIYTKVVFSEDLEDVLATGATARPEISYTVGTSPETQYNIVVHTNTLTSGDCQAKDDSGTREYHCLYTVATGNTGIFKTTVGIKTADKAGNTLATAYEKTASFTLDTTAPTVFSVVASGTTLTITMSEAIYATATPDTSDFTISGSVTVSDVVGIPTSAATADNSFTLTLSAALTTSAATLSYVSSTTATKKIKDVADNLLVSAANNNITNKIIIFSTIAGDDRINAAEDNSAVIIEGTSTGLAQNTEVTVKIDDIDLGPGANITKAATVRSNAWRVAIPASDVQNLQEGTLTIIASAPGAPDVTRTITYDRTPPTVTGTTYYPDVNLSTPLTSTSFLKVGKKIYTKVVFSEDVVTIPVNNTPDARPTILYTAGVSSETQYSFVAHAGTLSSGKCQAKDDSGTREYHCLYTVVAGNDGVFKTTVGTDTEDIAGNALTTAYEKAASLTLDTTAPTVTGTTYYSDVGLGNPITSGSFLKAGKKIYTKVVFSEDLEDVLATGVTARPEILYTVGTSPEIQYTIVTHSDTLTSGECQAKDDSNTREHHCLYTVAANDTGVFKTAVGIKTEDKAGNTLATAYEKTASFTLDTTAPTITAVTSFVSAKKKATITLTADHGNPASSTRNSNPIPEQAHFVFGGTCDSFAISQTVTVPDGRLTGETYTFTVKAPTGTYAANSCTVVMVDGAGNRSAPFTIPQSIRVKKSSGGGGFRVDPAISSIFSMIVTQAFGTSEQQLLQTYMLGDRHPTIKQAQALLNSTSCPVFPSGFNSLRSETAYLGSRSETEHLGPRTAQALLCYQKQNALAETGTLTHETFNHLTVQRVLQIFAPTHKVADQRDLKERLTALIAHLQGRLQDLLKERAAESSTPVVQVPPPTRSGITRRGLSVPSALVNIFSFGVTHPTVRVVQSLLNETSCPVSTSGAGSLGSETDYFGPKTDAAIRCYQKSQGLSVDGVLTPALYAVLVAPVSF